MVWQDEALCREYDPAYFFPETRGAARTQERFAVTVCAACPVSAECLNLRLSLDRSVFADVGVWGGTTPKQRETIRTRQRRKAS